MIGRTLESGFVVLTALLLLTGPVAVTAVSQPAQNTGGRTLQFDPSVPGEYNFTVTAEDGTAIVDGRQYETLRGALDAAAPGETIRLRGRFQGPVTIDTPGVTLRGTNGFGVVDGNANGTVLRIAAPNVTLDRVWVRNSGYDTAENDAGIWVNGSNATITDSRVTDVTFGIWIDGVPSARIDNATIVGREAVRPLSNRGNGIQLWRAERAVVTDTRITDVRDGLYFSWTSRARAENNTMWDLRYGVHYMYSESCRLVNNTAFDNDVGFALMLSENLTIRGNRAVNNTGTSGHGILLKRIDYSTIRDNDVVGNENGLFVYNSLHNTLASNLVLDNEVGVHLTAGSVEARVSNNTFIANGISVKAVIGSQVAWNTSHGNFWAGARTADLDNDGLSEVRYRPAGLVQGLIRENPAVQVFTHSPAFRAISTAERSLPVVESPGVIDYRPLVSPPTARWREYYDND